MIPDDVKNLFLQIQGLMSTDVRSFIDINERHDEKINITNMIKTCLNDKTHHLGGKVLKIYIFLKLWNSYCYFDLDAGAQSDTTEYIGKLKNIIISQLNQQRKKAFIQDHEIKINVLLDDLGDDFYKGHIRSKKIILEIFNHHLDVLTKQLEQIQKKQKSGPLFKYLQKNVLQKNQKIIDIKEKLKSYTSLTLPQKRDKNLISEDLVAHQIMEFITNNFSEDNFSYHLTKAIVETRKEYTKHRNVFFGSSIFRSIKADDANDLDQANALSKLLYMIAPNRSANNQSRKGILLKTLYTMANDGYEFKGDIFHKMKDNSFNFEKCAEKLIALIENPSQSNEKSAKHLQYSK